MAKITYTKTNWVNDVTKLNATNMNHIEDGIEAVTNATADIPTSEGTGTNSLVGNDIATNTAISENVTSFGTGNVGGLKGYYWSSIDLSAKTITLASAHTGGTAVTCGYAVGDIISIVNDSKFDECSRITAINNSIITVDTLPFTTVKEYEGDWTDFCIYCPEKANIGLADLGRDSFIAGNGNKGGNWCSVVAGRDNNVIGQYGVAMGRLNKVGYAGFATGRNNTCLGQYGTVAGGSENKVPASWSFAAGRKNNVNGLYSGSFGQNNIAGVRGYYFRTPEDDRNLLYLYSDVNCTIPARCEYVTNDRISAGIGARYINFTTIFGVGSHNIIRLNNPINLTDYSADAQFIYCEAKPDIGAAFVTSHATSFGLNSKALGRYSITIGNGNVVPSSGGIALGQNNRAGFMSFAAGYNNITDKEYCVMLGHDNKITVNQGYTIGTGLTVASGGEHQVVIGRYNKPIDGEAGRFVIGNGTSATDRKNILSVTSDGDLKVAGSLTLDMNGTKVTLTATQLTKLLALIK